MYTKIRIVCWGAVALIVAACMGEQESTGQSRPQTSGQASPETSGLVAYTGATLIDGTGAAAVVDSVVVVDGEKIVSAGALAATTLPAGIKSVDVSGKWIVPGLVDAHTHFMESGRIYTKPSFMDLTHLVPYEEEVKWMQARVPVTLQTYLCAGVTTSVSVGGPKFEYEVREQASATDKAPNVFVAHGPVSLVPSESLFPPFDGDTPVRTVSDAASATAMIRQGGEWGADLIKSGYLGGPLAPLEADYVAVHEAILAEAESQGFPVTTHVTELEPARKLVSIGVDSLQHLPLDAIVDDGFIDLAKDRGVIIVPTLAVFPRTFIEIYDQSFKLTEIERRCGDPEVIKTWYEVEDLPQPAPGLVDTFTAGVANAVANTKLLYDAGVPIAAGSDAGNSGLVHGATLHYELKLLANAGLSAADVIVAATLNSARVAGKDDLVGSVEPGKLADFLILNADPLSDVANLQKIDMVVKSGKAFAQSELLP